MYHVITVGTSSKSIKASDMEEGQYARVIQSDYRGYQGHIIVRCYEAWISLNNPKLTWGPKAPAFEVDILKPDTIINIKVGG